MNCDRAFELLTGDCESGGDYGASLAGHLLDCPHCARLAAEIGPALALFNEAALDRQPGKMRAINGPWCVAETSTASLSQRAKAVSNEHALSPWMSLVAALLVGLTLGGLNNGSQGRGGDLSASRMPARLLGTAVLGSLQLTPACLPESTGRRPKISTLGARPAFELLAQLDVADLACCTVCHAPGGAAADIRQAMQHVTRSCQACHTN